MSFKIDEMKKASAPRPLPKPGTQAARVISVVGLGVQPRKPFKDQPKTPAAKVWINFELVNDKYEVNGEKIPHRISPADLVISIDPKSALFKLVTSLDPNNANKWDISKLLGMPCLVTVVHAKSPDGEKTYANFNGAMPAPDGFPIPEATTPSVLFKFEEPTAESYSALPKFVRDKLKSAVNFPGSKVAALAEQLDAKLDSQSSDGAAQSDDSKVAY